MVDSIRRNDMKYKAVRGMEDILPTDADTWQWLEHTARRELEFYGYEEIRTPTVEDASIFTRSIGETTDIVTKEMYVFQDKKGRSLALRPEGTAPIVRAYIEHAMDKASAQSRLYYIGPMFRSERPQKGRSRQFHQIGVEFIGASSYLDDAQVIMQMSKMLESFGIMGANIKLNNLGCVEDKAKFGEELKKYLKDKKKSLCENCVRRIDKNVLRVLDCKKDSCIHAVREAPNVLESLCEPCRSGFEKLKRTLKALHVNFKESKNLVRGLDYYTGTVFEVTHSALGAQDAIGAGGRYDNLVKDFGGPNVGAIGYALGIERIILALKDAKAFPPTKTIFIASIGEEAALKAEVIAEHLRAGLSRSKNHARRIRVLTGTYGTSLKSQMRSADRQKSDFVLILGEDELKKQEILIKDMKTGKQDDPVDLGNIVIELQKRI